MLSIVKPEKSVSRHESRRSREEKGSVEIGGRLIFASECDRIEFGGAEMEGNFDENLG